MSILGDIIGREWLECELEDAKRELARVTERARESIREEIREEIRRRCAVNDSNDHQEVRFYETHSESIQRSEEMLILALSSPLQHKITFLEHLLS